MPNLGTKKKSNLSRMDKYTEDLPKLTNEMQLSIMNKVKTGELSVDDALYLARKDWEFLQQSLEEGVQETQPSQYNFSVHKHGRYMWHKRVLQIDFKTKMLCSIEKGIVNRQLPFAMVKSCDDGVGSKFFISFKGHHDYELEATSLEDKHKIMQLVNQIIYGNIYSDTEEGDEETHQQPQATQSLREGVLLLHRGGLASFKWVKYEVQLHPGQLTLTPFRSRAPADGEMTSNAPLPIVIHLSDGDTSVQKPPCPDAFTLITHKNKYQFKMPASDQMGDVQKERDNWVAAIHRLCSDWKRKSMGDLLFVESLQSLSIAEDAEDTNTDLESSGGFSGGSIIYPPADYVNTDITSSNGDTSQIYPPADYPKPVPAPRGCNRADDQDPSPPVLSPTSPTAAPISSPSPPSPSCTPTTSPSNVPESLKNESGSSAVKRPPNIPAPPPLPIKPKKNLSKTRTKAFHWDTVSPAKIAKSFWKQESTRRIEIDTSRLYEQFAIQDVGMFGATEQSNVQHILLNQKIAHNFNIFLKSFPVQPGELKDKLFIIKEEDGGLSDEHITSLRRYVPTVDDVEMYTSHKGPVADLHIVDQYMMEMCNIPYLSTQLDLLLSLRELPISMNDLQPVSFLGHLLLLLQRRHHRQRF